MNPDKERVSLAYFYNPKSDLLIHPAPELVTPETPSLYPAMTFDEYRLFIRTRGPQGKSQVESLKSPRWPFNYVRYIRLCMYMYVYIIFWTTAYNKASSKKRVHVSYMIYNDISCTVRDHVLVKDLYIMLSMLIVRFKGSRFCIWLIIISVFIF